MHHLRQDRSFSTFNLYLDDLVVVDVVQSVGSIPSSNDRGIGQEVGAMYPILKIKLQKKKKMFSLFSTLKMVLQASSLRSYILTYNSKT